MSSTVSSQSESSTSRNANLIINYLPQTMTDEQFRVMFAKYGDIRSARIIRNKTSGYSYGFGFVEYFNAEDAETAISNLNGQVINHKKIKVSFARPSSDEIKNANIYVTNLPSTFTEHDVRNLFADCGNIIQVRLLGNRTGTAFVLFNLNEEARQAISNFDRKLVPGTNCRMKVKFATNEPNRKNIVQEELPIPQNNINLTPKAPKRNRELLHPMMNPSHNNQPFNHPTNHNRSISSGPIRNTTHHNRFNPLSPPPLPSMMDDHQMLYSDRNHYHHNQYPRNEMDHSSHHHFIPNNHNADPTSSYMNPHSSYEGSSGSMDPSAGQYILFVYNIGPETTEFHLGKLFSYYGQVTRVNVIRKQGGTGEGRGYGFVTMTSYQDAANAIANLNGYKYFNNRPLQVSFKKI